MNTQGKEKALAKLAANDTNWQWHPYNKTTGGRAQFAAILLKFPDAMAIFCICLETRDDPQTWLLDKVLRMNGVEI